MRTNKELLIATIPFASEVRWRSWWHLWTTMSVLAVLLLIVCSDIIWLSRLPFSIVLGLVMVRFFVLYHDHQHGAILQHSRIADLIMRAFGLATLNPPSVWNRSHTYHHVSNSKSLIPNVGSFPIMTVDAYRNATRRQRLCYLARRHVVTILLAYVTIFFLGMCVAPLIANPRRHLDAGLAVLCHTGFLLWFALDEFDDLFLAVLLPCTVASAVGALLFYMQHNFAGARFRTGADWDYVFAALHSSSYIRTGRLGSWLTANIGYHHVHHLNHHIPFYRLPEAMAALQELQTPATISLSPANIRDCLRLHLFDSERNELVPRESAFSHARHDVT